MNIKAKYDLMQQLYTAWDDDNYCGCPDCQDPIGYGIHEHEAIEDLRNKLERPNEYIN